MNICKKLTLSLMLFSWAAAAASAQERADPRPAAAPSVVTISTAVKGVRITALGDVKQIRLEAFGEGDTPLYSSGFKAGNVFDWKLEDTQGLPLPDGTYLCVVTFRDVSGRAGMRQGRVVVRDGKLSYQLNEDEKAGAVEPEKALGAVTGDAGGAMTLTAHDGADGQVVSTRGGLSFRAGDFFAGKDRELMRLTPEGDLGLGVSTPGAKLDVNGTIRARGGILFPDGSLMTSADPGGRAAASAPPTAAGEPTASAVGGTGTPNKLSKWLDSSGTLGDSSLTESNGNVGVNNPAPATSLDVVGALTLRNTAASAGYRLGDRTSDPGRQMVYGAAPGSPYSVLNTFVQGSTLAAPRLAQFSAWTSDIDLNPSNATQFAFRHDPLAGGVIATIKYGAAQAGKVSIQANYADAGVPTQLVADTNGNVGVGTASPQARLDVAGDLRVSGDAVVNGNIAAKYQDVAEWVEASGRVGAGTVVVLDASRADAVRPSRRAYDTRVAGVVSAQPGLILGQAGAGRVMVATTGRVRVRVDARRRPVRIGDLLVTGEREGAAMRSVPLRAGGGRLHRPGTIIGKALEPLAKGEGEILVLLSLQ
jgi:hypothetical protein